MHRLLFVLAGALFCAACSIGGASRPAQFYALNVEGPAAGAAVVAPAAVIGVGPVGLPELFDRPQIVTRPDANRVVLAEYDRWGGGLVEEVQRVLLQDLTSRFSGATLVAWPWEHAETPALQVAVNFFRFDGDVGKEAYLSGVWELDDVAGGCRLEAHAFDIRQATAGGGYADFVGALSLGLAQLSDTIAARVRVAHPGC